MSLLRVQALPVGDDRKDDCKLAHGKNLRRTQEQEGEMGHRSPPCRGDSEQKVG